MTILRSINPVSWALALLLTLVLVSCGGGDSGLSRAEVEEIVREEMAAATPEAGPAITADDVEEAVRRAMDEVLPQEPGLSRAEVERIARSVVASIPSRSAQPEYTKFFVQNAVSRYETQGLDATLAYYSSEESIDGQWYVFIIDEDDILIAHPDTSRVGMDVKGWIGTDGYGYNYGPEILSATGDGKWVSYVFLNPENVSIATGNFESLELKNVWVVRHNGLLFASGWYISAEEFTRRLVSIAVDTFREGGLAATVAYFAAPESALAGLEDAIAYYNEAETVDGRWAAFIADEDGMIVAHSNPVMIGSGLGELFGDGPFHATEEGSWETNDSVRMWVAGYDGYVFGSGWRRDE